MDGRAPAIDRHRQLLIDSGRALMLIGTVVITHQLGTKEAASSSSNNTEHLMMLVAFLLWLLGAALAMLFVVARRFPRLTAAGATLARALRNYLFGGL
ncbi:unnamed protein product [Urochloa decumbens]|uniref:Uncharacterized protein n=1 Tax=Urochloa decumbens TaxID=240449 RepID=A0ABC9E017_9POAL